MKKLLLVLAVVFLLAVAGVAVLIATFDADRYRPMLVSELEKAIGRPVTLERLSLGWHSGLAMRLQGLAIYEGDVAARGEPLAQVESARALVRLWPLLRKKVRISSVVLTRPRIHVARDAQGRINVMGLAAAASPVAASHHPTAKGASSPVSLNIASFLIEDGSIHWTDALTTPPADLWVKPVDVTITNIALGEPMDVDLRASLGSTTPNLRFSGRFTSPGPTSRGSVERVTWTIDNLPLEQVLPLAGPGTPQLRGKLSVKFQGGVTTLEQAQWPQALSGSGNLKLTDGMVANLNILREVFERLSMLPGLVQTLEAKLPPEYQAKLAARDTTFSPIDVSMKVEDGALQFDDLRVRTDVFGLGGAGRVNLDGAMNLRLILRIDPALSAAIIRDVKELQALANPTGELELPVIVQGQAPRIAVLPDLNYVASKVIVTKAVDLLGTILKKQNQEMGQPPQDDVLGRILQRALQKHAPSGTPSQ